MCSYGTGVSCHHPRCLYGAGESLSHHHTLAFHARKQMQDRAPLISMPIVLRCDTSTALKRKTLQAWGNFQKRQLKVNELVIFNSLFIWPSIYPLSRGPPTEAASCSILVPMYVQCISYAPCSKRITHQLNSTTEVHLLRSFDIKMVYAV